MVGFGANSFLGCVQMNPNKMVASLNSTELVLYHVHMLPSNISVSYLLQHIENVHMMVGFMRVSRVEGVM